MGIQQNMADTIRMIMAINNKSVDDLAAELQIARSTLQGYLKAEGNPTAAMIEHMAERLNIDPAVLLTGLLDMDRRDIVILLFNIIQEIAMLPKKKQLRFAELFLELVLLWNSEG